MYKIYLLLTQSHDERNSKCNTATELGHFFHSLNDFLSSNFLIGGIFQPLILATIETESKKNL